MSIFFNGLVIVFLLPAANQPPNISMADYLQQRCQQGDEKACQRFEIMELEQERALAVETHASAFSRSLNHEQFEIDNKPNLEAAYPVVMRDYFQFETVAGNKKGILDERQLSSCARHYHNYWVNRKLWWPTTDEGKPDWAGIYVYIVDHYFGYCLRQF